MQYFKVILSLLLFMMTSVGHTTSLIPFGIPQKSTNIQIEQFAKERNMFIVGGYILKKVPKWHLDTTNKKGHFPKWVSEVGLVSTPHSGICSIYINSVDQEDDISLEKSYGLAKTIIHHINTSENAQNYDVMFDDWLDPNNNPQNLKYHYLDSIYTALDEKYAISYMWIKNKKRVYDISVKILQGSVKNSTMVRIHYAYIDHDECWSKNKNREWMPKKLD